MCWQRGACVCIHPVRMGSEITLPNKKYSTPIKTTI
jgi:hypothetical protein